MIRFIIRQIATLVFVCIAIIFLAYLGMHILANQAAAEFGRIAVEAPLAKAVDDTITFAGNLAQGDLGSYQTFNRSTQIADVLGPALANSLGLLAAAMTIAALLGIVFGAIIALTRWEKVRFPLLTMTAVGISVPSFLAVILLQQIGIQFNSAIGFRLISMGGFEWSFEKMLMPVLILTARPLASVTRTVYISLGQIMEEDYIRTAYSKGLSRFRVILTHAFRNMSIPFLSALAISFRFSLTTLIVVEFLFGWPGIGRNLFSAIAEGQTNLVVARVLVIGLSVQLINVLLDVAYRMIDPRTWTAE
jgi:ABC-type dipeptide/oligopeptide/nickel transport system permease component